jgi:putative nucleotide binding protein
MLRKKIEREEKAFILDFLKNGYPTDMRPLHQKTAIAQAIGLNKFTLLEVVPKKDEFLQPLEEVYIGEGKRDKIHHIIGRLPPSKLTNTARLELDDAVNTLIDTKEEEFLNFFNKAGPINMRMHQLELLPGIGKRHTEEILKEREESDFVSFADITERVKLVPNPKNVILKRILVELNNEDKHKIFTA